MEFLILVGGAWLISKIYEEKPVVYAEEGRIRVPYRLYADPASRSAIPPNEDFPFVLNKDEAAATNYLPKQSWKGMGGYLLQTRRKTGDQVFRQQYAATLV